MKKLLTLLFFVTTLNFNQLNAQSSIHSYTALAIDSSVIHFSNYYGKKVLIVNTASYCGYTAQYAGLEQLYQNYNQYNFEIIGFPCNDFGGQEPAKDSAIASFCTANYGVTFQMMHKISITASDTSPVYKWLQRANLNGVSNASVAWNFNKFLINECGQWVAYHHSTTTPLDTAITNWIMKPSCITTGLNNAKNELDNSVELVSSNPTRNEASFLIKKKSVLPYVFELFTIEGKLIQKSSTDSEKMNFDLSSFNSGMYFIKIQNGLAKKTIKIVVVK